MSGSETRRGFSWFWLCVFILFAAGLALATFSVVRGADRLATAAGAGSGFFILAALGSIFGRRRRIRLTSAYTRRAGELMDTFPQPVFVKDEGGVYRGCNQAFADFLSRKREDIIGRSDEELTRDQAERFKEADADLLARPGVKVYERAVQPRNGHRRTVVFHKASLRDLRGRIEGVFGSLQDITDRLRAEELRHDAEERLRVVLDNVNAGVALVDPEWRVLSMNARMKSWARAGDAGPQPLCYRIFQDPPREEPCPGCPVQKAFQDGGVHEAGTETTIAGARRHFRVVAAAVHDAAGRIAGAVEMVEDVTGRKLHEDEIRRLKGFNEDLVETMMDGVVLADAEGVFKFVNPPAAQMLGYTPFELIERHMDLILPEDQRLLVRRADERRVRGRADRYEVELLKKNGDRLSVLVSGVPRFENGRFAGSLGIFTDVTERKKLEREVRELSLRDELTRLLNRRGFFEFAPQTFKYAERLKKRLILLYADLDDFKEANDRLGHQEGDRLLVDVGLIIKKSFREGDLVARFGGDEFVVLAMETSRATPKTLRERLEERVELYNGRTKADRGYRLTLSIGVAFWDPEFPAALDDLIAQADARMYEDKKTRKNGARARRS